MDRKLITTAAVFFATTATALLATLAASPASADTLPGGDTQPNVTTVVPSPTPSGGPDLGWG
ncbi:hypothetical protein ACIRBX_16575 [Kitasatospora sp. NPDC096147]|uniref:hypothetical protein n=1 Tax=Kitasatospora sp. NPDC096147 TaxID=3364093 RepID=UPI00382B078E